MRATFYSKSHVRRQFGKPRRSSLWTMFDVYMCFYSLRYFTKRDENSSSDRPYEVAVFFLPRCSHIGSLLPLLEHRAEFPQFLDQGQSAGRVISSSQKLQLVSNLGNQGAAASGPCLMCTCASILSDTSQNAMKTPQAIDHMKLQFFSFLVAPTLGACSRFWSIGLSFLSFLIRDSRQDSLDG
jgi:hypothetical protein